MESRGGNSAGGSFVSYDLDLFISGTLWGMDGPGSRKYHICQGAAGFVLQSSFGPLGEQYLDLEKWKMVSSGKDPIQLDFSRWLHWNSFPPGSLALDVLGVAQYLVLRQFRNFSVY